MLCCIPLAFGHVDLLHSRIYLSCASPKRKITD